MMLQMSFLRVLGIVDTDISRRDPPFPCSVLFGVRSWVSQVGFNDMEA